jgi:hypothetical protein
LGEQCAVGHFHDRECDDFSIVTAGHGPRRLQDGAGPAAVPDASQNAIGQAGGIGFLGAAKSILRFEEAKKQKLAECVSMGTLLSFSLAIALTSATRRAMEL